MASAAATAGTRRAVTATATRPAASYTSDPGPDPAAAAAAGFASPAAATASSVPDTPVGSVASRVPLSSTRGSTASTTARPARFARRMSILRMSPLVTRSTSTGR